MPDPYYSDSHVTIYHGDCRDVLPTLDPVETCITDPPYNFTFMGHDWDDYSGREDVAFANWIAGFVDGEGCFRVQQHSRGSCTTAFQVKIRSDDESILHRMREFFGGIGTIKHEAAGRSNPVTAWVVQDKEGCAKLARFFIKYPLRAKKLRDFIPWAEAVWEWNTMERGNRWHGPADWSKLQRLKARIEKAREYRETPWSGHHFQDFTRSWAERLPLKPGGHLLAFGGTRTFHRLVAGIEEAGLLPRDTIAWLHGQGFPKSHSIEKATGDPEWAGYGTALKPAIEFITVAMNPLAGTFAENALKHGVAGLNIDGCRLPGAWTTWRKSDGDINHGRGAANTYGSWEVNTPKEHPSGRWPPNVILDEETAAMLDEEVGELTSGSRAEGRYDSGGRNAYGEYRANLREPLEASSGGPSRFFYTAKASRAERGDFNDHPTVKPLDLMAYLCRLTATPTGGTVLDPFMGSGSTLIAANRVGRKAIGIEQDERVCEIAVKRLERENLDLFATGEP